MDTLSLVHAVLGNQDTALGHARRALAILQAIGDRRSEGYCHSHLGWIQAAAGELPAAQAAYQQALQLRRELGQATLAMDDLAGLARVALAQGDEVEAKAKVEDILAWLANHSPDGIEFPVLVYLTCYQVLQATAGDDPAAGERARAALQAGYKLLQERADRIADPHVRRSFLENVSYNRDLLAAWKAKHSSDG